MGIRPRRSADSAGSAAGTDSGNGAGKPRASAARARLRLAAGAMAVAAGAAMVGCSGDSGDSDTLKVAVFEVAQADVVTTLREAFTGELTRQFGADGVEFDVKNANGEASLIQSIARDLSRSDADLIAVIGTPAVIAMAQADSTHPIIAIAMGDPVGAKVAESLEAPGGNVTGTIDYIDPGQLLDQLAEVSPAPQRIGTIYDPSNENSQVWIAALSEDIASREGLSLVETTVASSSDVQSAARSLIGRVDTILIGPDQAVATGMPAVGTVAYDNRIPLYITSGDASVHGVLATLGPDYSELGVDAGEVAAKVLRGADPATTPFGLPGELEWDVNEDTLAHLGITLPPAASGGA